MDGREDTDERAPYDDASFSPRGYLGCGLAVAVGGVLVILSSADSWVAVFPDSDTDALVGRVLGLALVAVGLLVALIAEGVRIGTVTALRHAARNDPRSVHERQSHDVQER